MYIMALASSCGTAFLRRERGVPRAGKGSGNAGSAVSVRRAPGHCVLGKDNLGLLERRVGLAYPTQSPIGPREDRDGHHAARGRKLTPYRDLWIYIKLVTNVLQQVLRLAANQSPI